ncbi:porin family protein [Viscerimonas tarda]
MQPNDKIKNIFSSKLTGFNPPVPEGMWDKISRNLTPEVGQVRARKLTLHRVAAFAAGVAAVLALALLFLTDDNDATKQLASEIATETNTPAMVANKTPKPDMVAATKTPNQAPALYAHSITLPQICDIVDMEDELTATDKAEPQIEGTTQKEEPSPEEKPANIEEARLKEDIAAFERLGQNNDEVLLAGNPGNKNNKNGFSVLFGGSSNMVKSEDKMAQAPSNFIKPVPLMAKGYHMAQMEELQIRYEKHIKVEHKQPISFGLKINKKVNRNFSVETGVVFTYLSSKIKPIESLSTVYQAEGTQKFYYLGIPVSVNYTFVRLGKAEFQISAGGMIQKDISGKIDGDQEIKKLFFDITSVEDRISNKISQDNPQLSFMANAGASYPIYGKLNVYATVGGAYYFDAENEYRTIYSDKNLQLDLNLGLKLKF